MGYNVVTIRSGDDIADDALYPVLSDEGAQYLVRLTEADGTPLHFNASSLDIETVVDSKVTTVLSLNDVSIECLITDSRVALACQKYDKGGGWVGFGAGAVVALAANGISKALAARRRKGSALVGQVRYPWLAQVGGKTKQGWLSAEQLRIVASRSKADGGGVIMLTLTVDKRTNSHALAREVARRAATWHLDHAPELSADREDQLAALQDAPLLTSTTPKKFSMHMTPRQYVATAATALPKHPAPTRSSPGEGDDEHL